jgi:hypothetical protein
VKPDSLVSAGQLPWEPSAAAEDVDVWYKFDLPLAGTYRLGDDLLLFLLITTAGDRSLWAYVPVPADRARAVTEAQFNGEAELQAFAAGCFSAQKAVFAVAQDFTIMVTSDAVPVGTGRHALLAAATAWYATRIAALLNREVEPAPEAGAGELLQAAQGMLGIALAAHA